ncbi:MAG: glycosyltransferase [Bacteroidetes bacterium]|nr:glycosyltransferase [Bacteroidota bacterium]MCW5896242.1 glycosyltransferase [Bacteroidota bacterium]
MFETANIHPVGIIHTRSAEYADLVARCAFVVLPSSAEGQPGSVVQCMWSGLIPIVTKETGIDTKGIGLTFPDDELSSIEATILEASEKSDQWVGEHSRMTRERAEAEFSVEAFELRWNQLIGEVKEVLRQRRAARV